MVMDPITVATSAVAIVASGVAIVVTVRKTSNEVASIATNTALSWAGEVAQLQDGLDTEREARRALQAELSCTQAQLRQELNVVKRSLAAYRKGVQVLIGQITDAGLVAAWHPPGDD